MNRLLSAVVLTAIVFCAPAWGQKDEKSTFPELHQEFLTKYRDAKNAASRAKLIDEYGPRFLALAEAAKGKEAVGPVSFLMQLSVRENRPEWRKKATDMIRAQVKEPHVTSYFTLLSLVKPDEVTVALLKEVLDANPDKVVRAKAARALVRANEHLGHMAQAATSEAGRKRFVEQFGEAHVKYLEANVKAFAERAAEFNKLLDTEFAGMVPSPPIGRPAPEVVSKDLAGQEVKLSDYKGKVVVLDIWATWCGPCRAMIPHERELVKRLKDRPFALISVSADRDQETLEKFLEKEPMPWVHWFNGKSGGLIEDWDIHAFPTIYVIDHKGVIRFTNVRDKKMDEAVDQLLKEMQDDKKAEK